MKLQTVLLLPRFVHDIRPINDLFRLHIVIHAVVSLTVYCPTVCVSIPDMLFKS
jgi:hypothetical protein